MRTAQILALCMALQSIPAASQQANSFVGKWSGLMSTGAGGTVAVDLLITETGGTWRMSTTGQKSHRNPCFGQDLPVVLRSQSATELSIDINGTAFLRGCITTTATLNSIDGKNLEGVLTDGRHVKFSRN